jgi:hypothetical protein
LRRSEGVSLLPKSRAKPGHISADAAAIRAEQTRPRYKMLKSLEGKDGGQGRNRTADASLFRAALYQLSYLAILGSQARLPKPLWTCETRQR